MQFPAPAGLKYDWFSLSHLKPAGDSFSALIARISLPLSFAVTNLWAQEIVGICTFFQASGDTNTFRLDGTEALSRRHLECPGITSSRGTIECKLTVSDRKWGGKWNEGRQFRSWQKKTQKTPTNSTGFSSVMLIPLWMGLILIIPSYLRILIKGIFKNQTCSNQGPVAYR